MGGCDTLVERVVKLYVFLMKINISWQQHAFMKAIWFHCNQMRHCSDCEMPWAEEIQVCVCVCVRTYSCQPADSTLLSLLISLCGL